MAGGSLGGAVALHTLHGIHQCELDLIREVIVDIHQHTSEIPHVGKTEVVFGLHGTGDDPEEILGRRAHAHHAVGLQLAEVDDRVAGIQPGGIGEALQHVSLGEVGIRHAEIAVQLRPRRLAGRKSRRAVHVVHEGRGVDSSGGVADDDTGTPLTEHLGQSAEQGGMSGGALLGLHGRHQIGLDAHHHALPHPI